MSEVRQSVNKDGDFYLTEHYKAEGYSDYYSIFRQLVHALNDCSLTDHPQAFKCKERLERFYSYLQVLLKKDDQDETVWNTLDREIVLLIKLDAPLAYYADYNWFFKDRHVIKISVPPGAGVKRKDHPEMAKQLEYLVKILRDISSVTKR